jgi:hypothetical protein
VRSLLDLHSFASWVDEFKSCSGTSSCAKAKLSLLVRILIFTTFPDPLVSVMAFMQLTFPLKLLYNLYRMYSTIKISKYIQVQNMYYEIMCAIFSTLVH